MLIAPADSPNTRHPALDRHQAPAALARTQLQSQATDRCRPRLLLTECAQTVVGAHHHKTVDGRSWCHQIASSLGVAGDVIRRRRSRPGLGVAAAGWRDRLAGASTFRVRQSSLTLLGTAAHAHPEELRLQRGRAWPLLHRGAPDHGLWGAAGAGRRARRSVAAAKRHATQMQDSAILQAGEPGRVLDRRWCRRFAIRSGVHNAQG